MGFASFDCVCFSNPPSKIVSRECYRSSAARHQSVPRLGRVRSSIRSAVAAHLFDLVRVHRAECAEGFDTRSGTDTATVAYPWNLPSIGREHKRDAHPYEATPSWLIREILESIPLKPPHATENEARTATRAAQTCEITSSDSDAAQCASGIGAAFPRSATRAFTLGLANQLLKIILGIKFTEGIEADADQTNA